MKILFKLSVLLLLVTGCAKIPVESIVLADALQTEGERMHNLNLVLLNRMFGAKRMAIEKFINEEYAPAAVKEFVNIVTKNAPATDFKKEFPELMQAISPKINARRDSLLQALDLVKESLVEKLNTDYRVFNNATMELKRLLESSAQVSKEKLAFFNTARQLSNNKLDFNGIENAVDKFIVSAGNVGGNVTLLSSQINQLLNK